MMEDLEKPLLEWTRFISRITDTAIEDSKKKGDKREDKRTESEKATAAVVGFYSNAARRKIEYAPAAAPPEPAQPVYEAPDTKLKFA